MTLTGVSLEFGQRLRCEKNIFKPARLSGLLQRLRQGHIPRRGFADIQLVKRPQHPRDTMLQAEEESAGDKCTLCPGLAREPTDIDFAYPL